MDSSKAPALENWEGDLRPLNVQPERAALCVRVDRSVSHVDKTPFSQRGGAQNKPMCSGGHVVRA